MNRLTMSGLALAILTGGALAQPAAPVPADALPPAMAGMKAPPPPPPGGPAAMMDDEGGPPPPPGGPRGGHGGPEGRRPPPPPPSRAGHFRLQHGDSTLDVKCADDEPMKACGDLTLQLLDKLLTMPAASLSNTTMPNASAPKP